jgi:putative AdoMet-dependent methyltransferase
MVGAEPRESISRSWWFPEYAPVGVELGTTEAVARFDANQGTDPARDDALLDRLDVAAGTRLVDLGCGTGSLVIRAALRGAEAHGVDVSLAMLDYCQARAHAAGVAAHWHRAGFLDYRHRGPRADVVTTKSALHQLPDAWKQQALLNAAAMLRSGGIFYMWDVAFSFDPHNADTELERWMDQERSCSHRLCGSPRSSTDGPACGCSLPGCFVGGSALAGGWWCCSVCR